MFTVRFTPSFKQGSNFSKQMSNTFHCHDLPNELKELLDKLQMLEYLPDKLKFAEAITIHSKRTLNGLKGLPWFLLQSDLRD
jgi:hypothetical protein